MTFGVKRGPIVTGFGPDLDAAYGYWLACLGSVLVYRAPWRRSELRDESYQRWLRLIGEEGVLQLRAASEAEAIA